MKNNERGFCIFYDWLDVFEVLSAEDVGEIVLAIGRYYTDGINPVEGLSDMAKPVAAMMYAQIKRAEKRASRYTGDRGIYTKTETKTETETETETYTDTDTETETEKTKETKQNSPAYARGTKEKSGVGGGEKENSDSSLSVTPRPLPTLAEVEKYVRENRLSGVNARHFYEYNSRRGWQIDGEPIRDWQSILDFWQNAHKKPLPAEGDFSNACPNFDVEYAFNKALERSYGTAEWNSG